MTFLVEMSVNGTGMMVRSSGGNNCFTSLLVKRIDETPAVIALIGQNCCVMILDEKVTSLRILGVLSCRDSKSQQITESIHHRMNFGSKAATTSAESLIDSRGMSSSGTMLVSMNVCPINHDVVHVSL